MSGFFQQSKSRGGPTAESGETRLTLAAFGKHPGWNDHMPGIGVETEALAYVQKSLYVGGIGKQVDSGAWEKLGPEKRLEGFDHIFLWQRANHTLMGQLWSSSDRKGRSKYPMVLCVDGEGISVEVNLQKMWAELERVREICKAATTAEQVVAECHAAQDRLREPGALGESKPRIVESVETRRRFLEYPDLGPACLGLLRVLHELRIASANDVGKRGSQTNDNALRSCHLRVPAGGESSTESLALWAAFFQCVAPKGAPVLLISRKTTNWLDVVVGEPATDDFFCLGVSLKALPLTTEIPYELSPELKPILEKVTSRFLGKAPMAVVVEQRAAATIPAANEKKVAEPPPSQKKRNLTLPLVLGAAILIGAGGLWLASANRSAKVVPFKSNSSAPVPSSATPVKAMGTGTADGNYDVAMQNGRAELATGDYAGAMTQADLALARKPNDEAALRLKRDAKAQQEAALAAIQRQKDYDAAMQSGRAKFKTGDYAGALTQADLALATKPSDEAALRLKSDAKAQQDAVMAAVQRQKEYDAAMSSGRAKFNAGDYAGAMTQADLALASKPNEEAALRLKSDAKAQQDAAMAAVQRQREYDAAMSSGRAKFNAGDYAGAMTQADLALASKPNEEAALRLKSDAKAQQDAAMAAVQRQRDYDAAMQSGQAAYARGDYTNAIERAKAALAIRADDAAATELQKKASAGKDLQNAQTCVDRGELEQAKLLCSAHAGTLAFDELAVKIKSGEAARFETELEVYLVRFGLLDPKKAKTNEARQETQWLGELPIQQRDQCLTDVEVLRKAFQSSGRLDAAREKQLNELKKAINNHL